MIGKIQKVVWMLPILSLAISIWLFKLQNDRCDYFDKRIAETEQQIEKQQATNERLQKATGTKP